MVSYFGLVCFCTVLVSAAAANTRASHNGFNWVGGKRNFYDDDVEWMMMGDGSGKPQLALLKGPRRTDLRVDYRKDVHFILYTKTNPSAGQRIYVSDPTGLSQTPYNGNNPTKFVIHGFTNDINSDVIQNIKNAYLSVGSYNVIGVDWGVLANAPWYNEAKDNVVGVGNYVGEMVNFLNSAGGSSNSRTHLIGHSLGAHVAGMAGAHATGTVARVTGLDTALPLFGDDPDSGRLDPSDAAFVDVIHTCGGWLGFMDTRGHVDFYPNGGVSVQPGCGISDVTGSCSHGKSIDLFVASIKNHNQYPAHKCTSVDNAEQGKCDAATSGYMGDGVSTSMRGIYWMATN